jgi:predicted ester cyclase
MSAEENKAILQRGAKAFNTPEDRSGWLEIHDRLVVANGLTAEPLDLEGMKRFYSGLWAAFPDLHITIDDMVGEADKVAWRLTATGTQKGEFRGIPPTGVKVTFEAQYIFRFRDQKIVERWTNLDRLGLLVQLGALQVPA